MAVDEGSEGGDGIGQRGAGGAQGEYVHGVFVVDVGRVTDLEVSGRSRGDGTEVADLGEPTDEDLDKTTGGFGGGEDVVLGEDRNQRQR